MTPHDEVECTRDESLVDPDLRALAQALFRSAPSLRTVVLAPDGARLELVRAAEPEEIDAIWEPLGELGRTGARGYR